MHGRPNRIQRAQITAGMPVSSECLQGGVREWTGSKVVCFQVEGWAVKDLWHTERSQETSVLGERRPPLRDTR
ncbi:hypothetical protein ANANG_G00112110 [Anguilla anguilla]|uniref:Uncharacterized protein n=1 Tax=Anguilla anguilla TaxID=7936 RepID=A0A9D3MKJ1_ANGAN|nr:hypothetical protein ANANG_G00112110 [Anguilla anguilla]